MQIGKSKASGAAAVTLLLILLLNSSASALAAKHPAAGSLGGQTAQHGFSAVQPLDNSNSTGTQGSDNGSQGGDNGNQSGDQQDQNETSPQNQSGNDTGEGNQVQNDSSGLQNDLNLTGTNGLEFSIVPASPNATGHGHANIQFEGLDVQVDVEVEGAQSNTNYTLVLSINGTGHTVGSMTTDGQGEGEVESGLTLGAPGTYAFGISLLIGSSPALTGSPATQLAILGSSSSHEDGQGDSQGGQVQEGDSVMLLPLSQAESTMLAQAQVTNRIPGVVTFNGLTSQVSVTDKSFSVGAGTLSGARFVIKVLSNNMAGSRVFVINLAQAVNLADHGVLLTIDGSRISQASSLSQVLSASPTDKPSYLALTTSAGYELLVSIPKFTTQATSILLSITNAVQGFVQLSGATMLASMAILGVAVTALHSKRKVYAPL